MKIFADLHLHSKYSRACSKDLNLENLEYWGRFKGLNLIGTGDFTHPLWFKEIKEKLVSNGKGFFKLKDDNSTIYFLLTTEISLIFSRQKNIKRIHVLIFYPDLESVEKLNKKLSIYTNLSSDGRPTIGMDLKDLIKIVLDINEKAIIIPAHIWTPWFSLFGSMSGFDSIDEAFGEYKKYIYAVETGLSSDPKMNWRLSQLDDFQIVSFSDSHSAYPHRIGREATLFELEDYSYDLLLKSLRDPDEKNKIILTIEFFPEEGKYHYDGHRICKVRYSPEESIENRYICSVCKKPVTIGVMSRVEKLSDRDKDYIAKNRPPFKHIIPLTEIISEAINSSPTSKKVLDIYMKVLSFFDNEFSFFLNFKDEDYLKLKNITPEKVIEAIKRFNDNKIYIEPGYDGEYGVIKIFGGEEKIEEKQKLKFLF
ncbi:MAG: endonuclease Q family protein [Minisyncoccia bacterium]